MLTGEGVKNRGGVYQEDSFIVLTAAVPTRNYPLIVLDKSTDFNVYKHSLSHWTPTKS